MLSLPPGTLVNRVVPKTKIHQNAKTTARLKKLLADQIQEILWLAKLSPETTNLPATPAVLEIDIFRLTLKTGELNVDLLEVIDKAIPYPIIFEIQYQQRHRYAAAYKRPSEARSAEWVIGSHFLTDWQDLPNVSASPSESTPALPTAIDLTTLYAALFQQVLPLSSREAEALPEYTARCNSWLVKQTEVAKLESRIRREKQYNHKVDLNSQLNELKRQINHLI